jgi:hypothetical protein
VIEEVEDDFYSSRTIRNDGAGETAGVDMKSDMPGVVYPWCPGEPVFADDLRVKMEGGAGFAPGCIGDLGPAGHCGRLQCGFMARLGRPAVRGHLTTCPSMNQVKSAREKTGSDANGAPHTNRIIPTLFTVADPAAPPSLPVSGLRGSQVTELDFWFAA